MGGSELIAYFALLAYTACALPVKQSVSQPTNFLTSALLINSPSHWRGGSKQLCEAELPARVKP